MKQVLLFFIFLTTSFITAQTIDRVDVKGVVLAKDRDVEGITVYNRSSNKGTTTNENGEFEIAVVQNDVVEISALQFQALTVTISEEVIASKALTIYLLDRVNQLDAVILRNGLSGDMELDLANIEHPPMLEINIGNVNAWQLEVDKSFDNSVIERELNKVTNKEGLYNGIDFIKVKNLLFKPKRKLPKQNEITEAKSPKLLVDVYSREYMSKIFNIPVDNVDGFIAFIENKGGVPQELFEKNREFDLIDFLVTERNLFLKQTNDKN
ncbi:carboxypeptidase-like regulatory domain-containing protein [Flavobacteriaceae bacterium XHP0103]|uniref:carboxypeptidase-like regulatory domain-containing protein n=1 Tax=Marixanthotalea marina TaxID=2844359 RepID=UPI002989A183|nr:carboxypeptidase-like regulatory domain-containing protein [Marixanthotalea marina]MBU3821913.1 carboxypeptidase-like regulatory domain-containing protein [Marixanthotalea marina]